MLDTGGMVPDPAYLERFRADLDALSAPGERIGIAVSGGPDSLALLLLAAAARPGLIEAATVDHGLRAEARAEADCVGETCGLLGVPHEVLTATWDETPTSAIQERAREQRYALLAGWLAQRNLAALATGHHADDQAETMIMRLNRGAGLRGLAGIRPTAVVPETARLLLRPLLGWRHAALVQICADAGIAPVDDPSNADDRFERVRLRQGMAAADWFDADGCARSATHLAQADDALDWTVQRLTLERIREVGRELHIDPNGLPRELRRRLVIAAFARLGAPEPRGAELQRALDALADGATTTLAGLKLCGGESWRISVAPSRRSVPDSTCG